jgi:hypothetical protein
MHRGRIAFIAALAALFALSCGDDEQGPSGSGENPTASILAVDASASANAITATWTACPDADFDEYRLYRSEAPGIQQDPDAATIVAILTAFDDTTWTDTGLEWDRTYYYALLTRDDEGLETWSNEDDATTPDSSAGDWLTCHDIQGEADTSPYLDQIVTVMGVVTVGGDEYYSSTSPYAVISDPEGGPWSGLVLYGDSAASLARGDSVLITGTVQEYYGMTELGYITDIVTLGTGAGLPAASGVQTADITIAGGAEQWEGVLVGVENAVVTSIGSYGEFMVDDGSGECMIGGIGDYSYNPVVGDTLFSAVGVGWYSYSDWKIQPRDDGDLDVGGGGPGEVLTCYEVQGQQAASPFEGQVVSVTGIVVVGGDEYYSSSQALSVIMDAAGGMWSGLPLYDSDIAGLARGDSVTVTGTVQEYYGFTELSYITSVQIHSSGHPLPAAENLQTGALATPADPEEWEGVLVRLQSVTVVDDSLGFGEWSVSDGSGACRIDDLGDYTYTPQIGDTIQEIVGVLWYSYDDFKVAPRDDGDLVR